MMNGEIYDLISTSPQAEEEQRKNNSHPILSNKALGMITSQGHHPCPVSFEVGIYQLGGYGLFLNSSDASWGGVGPFRGYGQGIVQVS